MRSVAVCLAFMCALATSALAGLLGPETRGHISNVAWLSTLGPDTVRTTGDSLTVHSSFIPATNTEYVLCIDSVKNVPPCTLGVAIVVYALDKTSAKLKPIIDTTMALCRPLQWVLPYGEKVVGYKYTTRLFFTLGAGDTAYVPHIEVYTRTASF